MALLILPLACAEQPRAQVIDVRNFQYVPPRAQLAPGDTLLFANHDAVPHTATARDGSWDTGEIAAGDTVRIAIPAGGEYFCAYHPNMIANISVTAN